MFQRTRPVLSVMFPWPKFVMLVFVWPSLYGPGSLFHTARSILVSLRTTMLLFFLPWVGFPPIST
ncbi:hypothetical protein B0J18DRAFT_183748 [Chaetomium sp. MPI-SDFR-AT-0129]|nr:hypothetical protein B0J18DRAFT_183748 [Chaetomium sp. MPI-SDFR-AT-0129]